MINLKEKIEGKKGEVVKLTITSYKDEGFGSQNGSFEMMLNPKDYTCTKGIRYNKEEIIDGGNIPIYQGYDNDNLKFEFTLDATGALSQDPTIKAKWQGKSLPTVLEGLEKAVYTYIGDTHQPPFLKIEWGTLSFAGRLDKMETKYLHFSAEGEPMRAQVTLEVIAFTNWKSQCKQKNKSSPDLTHLVTVKAGDTLPLLCEKIYQNAAYCSEVARVNNLNSLRHIELGTQLLFPPLSNEYN